MALDIRIRVGKALHTEPGLALVLSDDGCYWFLHPLFERLREQCGKYIDLYGDATFTRDDFPRLRRLLDEAERLAREQPETWKVHVGTQLERKTMKETKVYQAVRREQVLSFVVTLRCMIERAESLRGQIECLGD
jgi:hypothetical protein